MFVIKKARNRDGQRAKDWINAAIGELDNYNNPFEIIELSWKKSRTQLMADYGKTRGFEDTQITDSANGLAITHIRKGSGSIMWERPFNGYGPFVGRIAKTPYNMVKLAKCYRDGLWTIKNRAIDAEVRAMSDRLWKEGMTDQQRAFNEERIKRQHVLKSEVDMAEANAQAIRKMGGDPKAMVNPYVGKDKPPAPDETLTEERKALFKKEKELEELELRLKEMEARLMEKQEKKILESDTPIEYNTQYTLSELRKMKPTEIRRLARVEFGLTIRPAEDRNVAIEKILAAQNARKPTEEPELVTG